MRSPSVGYSSVLEIPSLWEGVWPLYFSFNFSILVILMTGSVTL